MTPLNWDGPTERPAKEMLTCEITVNLWPEEFEALDRYGDPRGLTALDVLAGAAANEARRIADLVDRRNR